MKKNIYVFDLDGTLADSLHRYKLQKGENKIDLQHWRQNSTPDQIAKDQPIHDMISLYNQAWRDPDTITVIATARIFCDSSHAWVLKHLAGFPDHISSRQGDHDHRSGNALKGEFINTLRSVLSGIGAIFFFDDNKDYLKQFKESVPDSRVFYIPSDQGF